jgi:D-alanyl-lipoteichoic acid acyltransferase DltB (MBOAT superfamily)
VQELFIKVFSLDMTSVHFISDLLSELQSHRPSLPSAHVVHFGTGLLIYIVACRFLMRSLCGIWREVLLAALNIAGVYGFLFFGRHSHYSEIFAIYVVLVTLQYATLRAFSGKAGWLPWLAFFTPIAVLIAVRYIPGLIYEKVGQTFGLIWQDVPAMVGVSYMAFRCSRLVLEIRNGFVPRPDFWEYLNFAFFLPTMPVGPINSYGNYRRGFEAAAYDAPAGRAALRILIGLVKYLFLGNLCDSVTYSSLLLDDHLHHWIDLPVAMLFFYMYLYLNFSGFCDMAIGAAGLIGIPVPENFNNPFAARNVKDFWNRWHITLSQYMRDMVFSPSSKFFVGKFGIKQADHAVAIAIFIVFLLIGIWHGVGWNFAALGMMHALGVVSNHYYTIFLKKKLGRDRFKAYNENRWIRSVAVVFTFCYCGASLIFFANTFADIKEIFSILK